MVCIVRSFGLLLFGIFFAPVGLKGLAAWDVSGATNRRAIESSMPVVCHGPQGTVYGEPRRQTGNMSRNQNRSQNKTIYTLELRQKSKCFKIRQVNPIGFADWKEAIAEIPTIINVGVEI